jgi:alpha-beta hydrolase superfamily lysophospholipase
MTPSDFEIDGTRGRIVVHRWDVDDPRYVVLLSHGYGEHARRYDHVAERLNADGAAVYAPDHHGHGRSDGERALADDLDSAVEDLHLVAERAAAEHAGLPTVLVGHSMGGLIAGRYAQKYGDELTALVMSAPVVGGNPELEALAELDPFPDVPIDPAVLSRDAEVGIAYAEDPLVYHGPFRLETLMSLGASAAAFAEGGTFGDLPTLWIHGEDDQLVPLRYTRPAVEAARGSAFEERTYPGARHELFNETNRDEVLDDVVAFISRSAASPSG